MRSQPIPLRLCLSLALLSILAGLPAPGRAQNLLRVDSELDTVDALPGDGLCATAAGLCSLRAAVQEANALPGLDRIVLPAGRFALSLVGIDEDAAGLGDLDVSETLEVVGAGAEQSLIDALLADRGWDVAASASLVLKGLSVVDGVTPASSASDAVERAGGCIRAFGPLLLNDVTLRDCEAGYAGGAIYTGAWLELHGSRVLRSDSGSGGGITAGAAWIDSSEIASNHATTGGGIEAERYLIVRNSHIHQNRATGGGGIAATGTTVLMDTRLSENWANGGGGMQHRGGGQLVILRSSIEANQATAGGGLSLSGPALLDQVSVLNNHATSAGGLEQNSRSAADDTAIRVINSSFSGNTGSGIQVSGQITLTHSTLADATAISLRSGASLASDASIFAGRCNATEGSMRSLGSNLSQESGYPFDASLGDRIAPALLGPLADNGGPTLSLAPLAGSPAIDAADAAGCPVLDQRGHARPAGAGCDIGAVETGALAASWPTETPWPRPGDPPATPTRLAWEPIVPPTAEAEDEGGLVLEDQWGGAGRAMVEYEGRLLIARGAELVLVDPEAGWRVERRYRAPGLIRSLSVDGQRAALRLPGAVEILDLSQPDSIGLQQRLEIEPLFSPTGQAARYADYGGDVILAEGRLWATVLDAGVETLRDTHLRVLSAQWVDPPAGSTDPAWRWIGTWGRRHRYIDGQLRHFGTVLAGQRLWLGLSVENRFLRQSELVELNPFGADAAIELDSHGWPGIGQALVGGGDRLALAWSEEGQAQSRIQLLSLASVQAPPRAIGETFVKSDLLQLSLDADSDQVLAVFREPEFELDAWIFPVRGYRPDAGALVEQGRSVAYHAPAALGMLDGRLYMLELQGNVSEIIWQRLKGPLRVMAGMGPLASLQIGGDWIYALPSRCSGTWPIDHGQLLTLAIDAPDRLRLAGGWQADPPIQTDDCFASPNSRRLTLDRHAEHALVPLDRGGLAILSLADPSAPRLQQRSVFTDTRGYSTSVQSIVVEGSRAFLSSLGGLHSLDLNLPKAPIEIGRLDSGRSGLSGPLLAQGERIYSGGNELQIFDVSDPTAPLSLVEQPVYTIAGGRRSNALLVAGAVAYAPSSNGLQSIDLSDPRRPKVLDDRRLVPYGVVNDLARVGTRLLVAAGEAGLFVFDVSDPSQLEAVARYPVVGGAYGLQVRGDRIYVAAGDGGLALLRYPGLQGRYHSYLPRLSR